jgi:hypothetical protein
MYDLGCSGVESLAQSGSPRIAYIAGYAAGAHLTEPVNQSFSLTGTKPGAITFGHDARCESCIGFGCYPLDYLCFDHPGSD